MSGPTPRSSSVWLVALAVGVFQVVGSFGAANNQPDRKGIDLLAIVLVLLGPAALAVRDRWPLLAVAVSLAAADVYIALGYPYGPIFVSVVVAIFTAVVAGQRRGTWVLVALGYVGFLVASALDREAHEVGWLAYALVAGWLAVVLAVAELVRSRRAQVIERASAERERRQRREGDARLRLAQDLHDVLAHNISLINVQAGVALHLLDDQPDAARPALANIKQASHEALQELRTALDVLRRGEDAPRAPAPRLADLDQLAATVAASGLDVRVEVDDDRTAPAPALPAAVELAAFRIVQEALTNVSRHAQASRATVRVRYDHGVTVEVLDDGIGGSVTPGNGLVGMRERAAALGGHVEAGPRPGGGFRVHAQLPVATP